MPSRWVLNLDLKHRKENNMDIYEKKYKEALEKAKKEWSNNLDNAYKNYRERLEIIFPELKESEDEIIRKSIIEFFESQDDNTTYSLVPKKDILAWLEKQGEQEEPQVYKTEDGEIITYSENEGYKVVESKFHEGDWITNGIETVQIIGYDIDYGYQVDYKGNLQHRDTDIIEKDYHLWTIQDAKEGDVLSYNYNDADWILIYKNIISAKSDDVPYDILMYHALFTGTNFYDNGTIVMVNDNGIVVMVSENHGSYFTPATKEQYNILKKAMSASEYEWDAVKKELKKIEKQGEKKEINPTL